MRKWLLHIVLLLLVIPVQAQFDNSGFAYRGILVEQTGINMAGQDMDVRITVYPTNSPSTIFWEAEHNVTTDDKGMFLITIGHGTPTGNGSYTDFDDLPFATEAVGMKVELDLNPTGTSYFTYADQSIWAVPFAYHALVTDVDPALSFDFQDVDTAGVVQNYLLLWDGTSWIVFDAANAAQVTYAGNAGNSLVADTAQFGYVAVPINDDTAQFAFYTDSSNYAVYAGYAPYADTATYSDTSVYAHDGHFWKLNGNSGLTGVHALGSNNNEPLLVYQNNAEHFRIDEQGRFHRGLTDSVQSFRMLMNGAIRFFGEQDSGQYWSPPAGNYWYWSPDQNTLRIGLMTDTFWNKNSTGKYSVAIGRECFSASNYAWAIGDSCVVQSIPANGNLSYGTAGIALGKMCETNGQYAISTGYHSNARIARSAAMGYKCITDDGYASIAMGYECEVDGNIVTGFALGYRAKATGWYTTALGNYAHCDSSYGSFVWGDHSTTNYITTPTYDRHQFVARAAGGFYFYSDANATMGSFLAAGSGSWASISDRRKKHNILALDPQDVLARIRDLKIYDWNYESQDAAIRHIGPMAQAFYRGFGLGANPSRLASVDADGVTMMGVKALDMRFQQIEARAEAVQNSQTTEAEANDNIDARLDRLEQELEQLKATLNE